MNSTTYQPEKGDIVFIDCDPQAGTEQAGRRPALVLSARDFNIATGLIFACPITNQLKGGPFEVPLPRGAKVTGAVLTDHMKSFDWIARNAELKSRVSESTLDEVIGRIMAIMQA